MDELEVKEMATPEGAKGLLDTTALAGLGITPKLMNQEVIIDLTAEQLKDMILKGADPRAKQAVSLELHEGKLTLKIKLF